VFTAAIFHLCRWKITFTAGNCHFYAAVGVEPMKSLCNHDYMPTGKAAYCPVLSIRLFVYLSVLDGLHHSRIKGLS